MLTGVLPCGQQPVPEAEPLGDERFLAAVAGGCARGMDQVPVQSCDVFQCDSAVAWLDMD